MKVLSSSGLRRRVALGVASGALIGGGVLAGPALGGQPPETPSGFSCRASALRVSADGLLHLDLEPVVANAGAAACSSESRNGVATGIPGVLSVKLLNAATDDSAGGAADASAADIEINPLGLVSIRVRLLHATASYTCQKGMPTPSAGGEVLGLSINGAEVPLGTDPVTIPLPLLGYLAINETTTTPTSITRDALHLHLDVLGLQKADVVISEAMADVEGNPCATGKPVPPKSDPAVAPAAAAPASVVRVATPRMTRQISARLKTLRAHQHSNRAKKVHRSRHKAVHHPARKAARAK